MCGGGRRRARALRRARAQVAARGGRGGEALPRARARYAVAPVLLATRIFYTPHIIDIVVMFCYDAKKIKFNSVAGIYTDFEPLYQESRRAFVPYPHLF